MGLRRGLVLGAAATASMLLAWLRVRRRRGHRGFDCAFGDELETDAKVAYRLVWGREEADALVLCVHGLAGDSRAWVDLAPMIAALDGVKAIACVDLPGHGRTAIACPWRDDVASAAVAAIAGVARDAARRAGPVRRLVVVGFSMGTLHATRFAAAASEHPAPLAALALLCPVLAPNGSSFERLLVPSPLFPIAWYFHGADHVIASQADDFALALADEKTRTAARRHVAAAELRVEQQISGNGGYADRVGNEIRHLLSSNDGTSLLAPALANLLGSRAAPPRVVLLFGADDTVVGGGVPPNAAGLGAADVVVVPGAGHKPISTHPRAVVAALAPLFTKTPLLKRAT